MRACTTLEIHQAFTSDHNPKGHADTERCLRTLKEACPWMREWTCPLAFVRALAVWIADDNEHYLHSSLGDKTPSQFARDSSTRHSTPFLAA